MLSFLFIIYLLSVLVMFCIINTNTWRNKSIMTFIALLPVVNTLLVFWMISLFVRLLINKN
jgi:hypothetical protein